MDDRMVLCSGARPEQHEAPCPVLVVRVLSVHRGEEFGRRDPDRRVFVARHVQHKEAVGISIVGCQRRDVPPLSWPMARRR